MKRIQTLFILLSLTLLMALMTPLSSTAYVPSMYQALGTSFQSAFNLDDIVSTNDQYPSLLKYYSSDCHLFGFKVYFPPGAGVLSIQTRILGLDGYCADYKDPITGNWIQKPYELVAYADPNCTGANVVYTGSQTHTFAEKTSRFDLYATNPEATQGIWIYVKFTKCSNASNCPFAVDFTHSYGNFDIERFSAWYSAVDWQVNGDPTEACNGASPINNTLSINPHVTSTDGLTVRFDSGVKNATGTVSYFWDFGDGRTSATANPTHHYEVQGSYMATLNVSDRNTSISSSLAVRVMDDPTNVEVTLTADPTSGLSPLRVSFSCDVNGSGTPLYYYAWDFNADDSVGFSEPERDRNVASNTYTFGVYTVAVKVTDRTGILVGTDTIVIDVKNDEEDPVPSIGYDEGYDDGRRYCQANPGACGIQEATMDSMFNFAIPRYVSDGGEDLFPECRNYLFTFMNRGNVEKTVALHHMMSEEDDAVLVWQLVDFQISKADEEHDVTGPRSDGGPEYWEGYDDAQTTCRIDYVACDIAETEMNQGDMTFTVPRFIKPSGENMLPGYENFTFKQLTYGELEVLYHAEKDALLWEMVGMECR